MTIYDELRRSAWCMSFVCRGRAMRAKMTADWVRAMRAKIKRDPIGSAGDYAYDKRPALIVRVRPTGHAAWMMNARWEPGKAPATRTIGDFEDLSLKEADAIAADWHHRRKHEGFDPLEERRKRAVLRERHREKLIGKLVEEFIADHVAGTATAHDTTLRVKREIGERWQHRAVDEVRRPDVIAAVKQVGKRGSQTARNAHAQMSGFFTWAIGQGLIETNPARGIDLDSLLGARVPRQRVLTDIETAAVWHSAQEIPVFGPAVRVLQLTGLRLNEVIRCEWGEIDESAKRIVIPPERFKAGFSHICPLPPDALAILMAQSKVGKSPFVFTLTGENPVSNIGRLKVKLDERIAERLGEPMPHWTLHDLRRTLRTRLASLRVPPHIAEMVLGHGKRGMARVYDQHHYEPEMRAALTKWQNLLRTIVARN
jgi:integrase